MLAPLEGPLPPSHLAHYKEIPFFIIQIVRSAAAARKKICLSRSPNYDKTKYLPSFYYIYIKFFPFCFFFLCILAETFVQTGGNVAYD